MKNLQVKKAIIPAAGLGTRFLPLSKAVPKELLPLVDEPMISYVVKEAKDAEINQIVFVLSEQGKGLLSYFKPSAKLETVLRKRGQKERLSILKKAEQDFERLSFSIAVQKTPNGDGDAVLKAKKQVGSSAFAVLFCDDIFVSSTPAILQLKKVFSTAQKPVIGLKRVEQDKLSSYGVARVEKIANKLYKIKSLVEKPSLGEAPSDLAICGRYIFPPEIFSYLSKAEPNKKGEIILVEALKKMLEDGKIIYGCELDGEWLECGKTIDWLKSNLRLCFEHPRYGSILKQWVKKMK